MCLKVEHHSSPVLFQHPTPGNLSPDGSLGFRGRQRGHQHQPATGSLWALEDSKEGENGSVRVPSSHKPQGPRAWSVLRSNIEKTMVTVFLYGKHASGPVWKYENPLICLNWVSWGPNEICQKIGVVWIQSSIFVIKHFKVFLYLSEFLFFKKKKRQRKPPQWLY